MKILIGIIFSLYSSVNLAQNFWNTSNIQTPHKLAFKITGEFESLDLEFQNFVEALAKAPKLNFDIKQKGILLDLPILNHGLVTFEVYESSVMQSKLQAKFPQLKTYKAYSQDGRFRSRFVITSKGLHFTIIGAHQIYQIDPLSPDQYVGYDLKNYDISKTQDAFSCGTKSLAEFDNQDGHLSMQNTIDFSKSGPLAKESVEMREYRLAIACTGEFGAKWGETKEQVLETIVTSLNALNLIWENDLAIRMVLVDQQLEVIFLDSMTDPYDQADSGFTLIAINTNVINNAIGFNNYDVGHIYTNACTDTGGVANLESTCGGSKGAGVSCMSGSNIAFQTLRVAAHEFGHQMGANHSFNNCSGNENFGTAYEPGGGSTIMSYSGTCGTNRIQNGPDPYYHNISLNEIFNHTRAGGGTCGTIFETGNTNPEVTIEMESNFTIPKSTPFVLTGQASDDEDQNLSFNWEHH